MATLAKTTSTSTYGMATLNNNKGDIFIESMDMQYNNDNNNDYHCSSLSVLTKKVPHNTADVHKFLADEYLKAKGLNLTLDEIIETHYPEMLI